MARRDDDGTPPWLAEAEPEPRGRTVMPRARLFGGVAVLLGLLAVVIAGLVYLVTRERTGPSAATVDPADVPLIEALPGPVKVPPDSPGGKIYEGADQSIYTAGAGLETQGTAIDLGALPEEPMARPGTEAAGDPALPGTIPPPEDAVDAPAPASLPPVVIKLPPKPQPARVEPAAPPAATPAPPPAAGTAALQLGAFSTSANANAAWQDYAGRFGYLAGLGKRVVKIERNGETLYRLLATGVADKAAAADLCARLKVAGEACLVAE